MKEVPSPDGLTRSFQEDGYTIQLFKYNKEIEETIERLPVLFDRLRIIRPYLEQTLEYMSESEQRSHLRTEV
jgi:hypothetical protein